MISFSLRRPVAVLMLTLAAALCGVVAGWRVPIELLPETELPRLTVRASWPGASPEQTEAFLTAPLEAVVQQVAGVETVRSISEEQGGAGVANVEVEFARGTHMDFARLELSERLAALEDALPPNARRPVVEPYVPDEFQAQTRPFLRYTVTGPYTTEALREYLDDRLLPEVRQVAGVADARALGGRGRMLDVELDETKLLSLGLTPEMVRARIAALESGRAVGVLRRGGVEYALRVDASATEISELEQLPITSGGARVVRLGDIARIHDGYEEPYSYYRIDGRPAVSFDVFRRAGSNAVRVADAVKGKVASLEGAHPAGVRLLLDEDESTAIRAQFSDLRLRALSGALVVLLVLIAFLRSSRSAAVVFASIAFTVLLVLNLVYFAGLSLNLLTLMGLAMGFGLVIDNAIVVVENIDRRLRGGDALAEAAERGAKDMVLPVLASTLTNVVVFIPFFYLQGDLRLYYLPMAVVVGVVNLASLLVSFTLTPALAARVMGAPHPPAPSPTRGEGESGRTEHVPLSPRGRGGAERGTSEAGVRAGARSGSPAPLYLRAYSGLVRATLRWPKMTMLIAVLLLGGSAYLFQKKVTRGRAWSVGGEETKILVSIGQPRGEELASTDLLARRFEAVLARMPEVERFTSRVYPYGARIEAAFTDSVAKTSAPFAVKDRLTREARQVGGASVSIQGFGPGFFGGGGGGAPSYGIQVLGYNYETVREIAEDLGRRLQRYPRIREVDTNSSSGWYSRERATEIVLRLDRARLALHGLSAADAVRQVASRVGAFSRQDVLRLGGEELGLLVRTGDSYAVDVRALEDLLIPAPGGGAVRLGAVGTLEEREVLGRIVRKDQQYERVVAYEFRGPVKLGDRVQNAVLETTRLPVGYSVARRAGWSWSSEEQRQIYAVLAAALVLVFMITAALFESLRQPMIVLLTVPMALVGVFAAFLLTGATFTREAFIGVIMMSGVVVNNAILLVDRVNGLRRGEGEGMALGDAVLRGTLERVRPILMTNATTILGMLPLVLFGDAADARIWNALTYALIGGLASAAVLVLTVTPALYLLFERRAAARAALSAAASTPSPTLSAAQ